MMERLYDDLFIDFDDTLCDTHGNAVVALREVFDSFGLCQWFSNPEDFYAAYWTANIDLWRQYGKGEITRDFLIVERFRRPLSQGQGLEVTARLCLDMNDRFLDRCAEQPGVVEGAHELVDYLRSRGYRLHLTSNGFHEVQYRKIHSCGFDGCFDTVILSEDARVNKPAKGYFDYAFRVSQAKPERTLMIGDGWDSDMRGALDYGLDTIYFNRFPQYPAPEAVKYEVHSLKKIIQIL
jgi:putative hydrolase of the HAD superfamily